MNMKIKCHKCRGRGQVHTLGCMYYECDMCKGVGELEFEHAIEVAAKEVVEDKPKKTRTRKPKDVESNK